MTESHITHIKNAAGDLKKGVTIDRSLSPAEKAGKYISDILAINSGRPILLLIAGGSSVAVVEHINPEYLDEQLTVTVTDERFTDDILENNFDNLQSTSFYNELIQVDAFCINTSVVEGDTIETHAARFENNIRDWMADFPKGIIIALYGIGADGHIGGIIPGLYKGDAFKMKFDSDRLVETVVDPSKASAFPERVSTTLTFMKRVDYPVIYTTGDIKKGALEKALDTHTSIEDIPARIILDMKAPTIFTDIELSLPDTNSAK